MRHTWLARVCLPAFRAVSFSNDGGALLSSGRDGRLVLTPTDTWTPAPGGLAYPTMRKKPAVAAASGAAAGAGGEAALTAGSARADRYLTSALLSPDGGAAACVSGAEGLVRLWLLPRGGAGGPEGAVFVALGGHEGQVGASGRLGLHVLQSLHRPPRARLSRVLLSERSISLSPLSPLSP
jgi:hypothetical protein